LLLIVPTIIRDNIARADEWYSEIFQHLFEKASESSLKDWKESPFDCHLLRWMNVNGDEEARGGILRILLHPQVRSFAVRNATGKQDFKNLLSDLQFFPLASTPPNVIAVYFLLGCHRPGSKALKSDMGYVGQARSLKLNKSGAAALGHRIPCHREQIDRLRRIRAEKKRDPGSTRFKDPEGKSARGNSRFLWSHQRLAHEDITEVVWTILMAFPLFENHEWNRSHLIFLLILAEAIDLIYMGTSVDPKAKCFAPGWAMELAYEIKPKTMPKPHFEGLNRALPVKQNVHFLAPLRMHWSPAEVLLFMEIFQEYKSLFFSRNPPEVERRKPGINWDLVEEKLREKGIEKPRNQIQYLYGSLSNAPSSPLESYSGFRLRSQWPEIHHLKSFLEQENLVNPPKDDYDLFYHIPSLEEGTLTYAELESFLEQRGYSTRNFPKRSIDSKTWYFSWGARVLPYMLHRDVWERIDGKSDLLIMLYLSNDISRTSFDVENASSQALQACTRSRQTSRFALCLENGAEDTV
jgi:hypothetical protein